MPKMIVSIDGVVTKEVQLSKDRTTLGRRPYNDVVIDSLAVSGEHAVIQVIGSEVYLEDLNSTNGSYLNGKAVKKQLLQHDDVIEIGKYRIKFSADVDAQSESLVVAKPSGAAKLQSGARAAVATAAIKVLSGVATGREVALTKVVTTIGKPGIAIAAITRRASGHVIAHVEGVNRPLINGIQISGDEVVLNDGDVIELAGTQMQFLHK